MSIRSRLDVELTESDISKDTLRLSSKPTYAIENPEMKSLQWRNPTHEIEDLKLTSSN